MRRSRLALACLVAVALAPGTVLREAPRTPVEQAPVRALPIAADAVRLGPFVLEGAWRIVSANDWHGGYSALVATSRNRLLAASDTGRFLALDVAQETPRVRAAGIVRDLPQGAGPQSKASRDIEALAFDPASGSIWAALESTNRIERYDRGLAFVARAAPVAMRDWSGNSGPEAFARFADGRFFVIEERAGRGRGAGHRALLFSADPTGDGESRSFTVLAPRGYRPVDLAPLDESRALVLYRKLVFLPWPRFATALGVVDIDRPGPDGVFRPRLLAEFDGRVPQDNFEGLAVTREGGARHLWLISDDNFMIYQRNLLLKLRWDEREKAPE